MTISIIAHQRLTDMLEDIGLNYDDLLEFMPNWMTVERLQSLLGDYRLGTLTPLQVAELDAVLEIVPALDDILHHLKHD